jgi:hypothetical protein
MPPPPQPFPFSFWRMSSVSPSTLAMSGWWQDDGFVGGAGAIWPGTASLGASGGNSLTNGSGVQQMTVGGGLNGHTTAAGNSGNSTNQFGTGTQPISTYITAGNWSLFVVAKITSIPSNGANPYINNAALVGDGTDWGLYAKSSNPTAQFAQIGLAPHPGSQIANVDFSLNAWHFYQAYYDDTSFLINARVDSGAWVQSAQVGDVASVVNTFGLGRNFGGSGLSVSGEFANVGLSKQTFTQAQFDGIRAYMNARYATSF